MKAVLFDFNGTLFQDTQYHIDTWIDYIEETLHIKFSEEDFKKRIYGRDNNAIIRDIFHTDDNQEVWRISEEKEARYRLLCMTKPIHLVKGAQTLFEDLKKNQIPFTIATGANKSNVDFYFQVFHLDKWFDYDQVVYDDGYMPGKPDPTVFLLAAKKLNVDISDCLVIEDSPAGVIAAKKAKTEKIYVLSDQKTFDIPVDGIFSDFDELRGSLCLKQKD